MRDELEKRMEEMDRQEEDKMQQREEAGSKKGEEMK
jgi:hypothetical protein